MGEVWATEYYFKGSSYDNILKWFSRTCSAFSSSEGTENTYIGSRESKNLPRLRLRSARFSGDHWTKTAMKYFLPVQACDMPGAALSNIAIWQDAEMRGTLAWYRQVADNLMPAKFRIARCVSVEISLAEASEEVLWQELETRTSEFLSLLHEIRDGERDLPKELVRANAPATSDKSQPNLLDLCCELSQRMLSHCNFCR